MNAQDVLKHEWPPMLATLAGPHDVGTDYDVIEKKYDGFRALAAVIGGEVVLQSRNGLDLARRFSRVAKALQALPDVVVDGELAGKDFHALQIGSPDVDYVLFDCLWWRGEDLRARPLQERRKILQTLLKKKISRLYLSERFSPPLAKALARAERQGCEGVVCKKNNGAYLAGRQRDWLKVKFLKADEFAIAGFVPHSHGNEEIGALVLATRGRHPHIVGKVGTGFSQAMRGQLFRLLTPLRISAPPLPDAPRERDIVWCRPERVAEVAFSEITPDGRLRHPSFQRLREDKEHAR